MQPNDTAPAHQAPGQDRFDRALGNLIGLPDVLNTAATTVRHASALVGSAQTFIIQTYRRRDDGGGGGKVGKDSGDTVFLEYVDDRGSIRLVIPPPVTKVIARQRDALTARARKKSAKASAADRKARGIVPAFLKAKRTAAKK